MKKYNIKQVFSETKFALGEITISDRELQKIIKATVHSTRKKRPQDLHPDTSTLSAKSLDIGQDEHYSQMKTSATKLVEESNRKYPPLKVGNIVRVHWRTQENGDV